MSAVMEAVSHDGLVVPAASSPETMLQAVRELADGPLAELADDIDRRGIYPKQILHRLGELGAFNLKTAVDRLIPLDSPHECTHSRPRYPSPFG